MFNKPRTISIPISQRNSQLAALFLLSIFSSLCALGLTRPPDRVAIPCATAALKQGVVVESVAKKSEGEKAGLAEGDVILSWTRSDVRGEFESPFDLSKIQTEEEPRGRVILEGTQDGLKRTWAMGPENWGIQVRPSLSSTLLAIYREGIELANAGKLSEAADRWRATAAAGQKSQCSLLSPWFLFHAAEAFANARQWKDASDLYQEAIRSAAGSSPEVRAQILQALARAFEQESDWANAEKYQQEALKEIRRANSESLAVAASLNSLGRIDDDGGHLARAEQYFHQALAICEKLAPGSLAAAKSLHNLGSVADERGDLEKAEEYDHQALEIRQALAPGGLDVAASLHSLGDVADDRGNLAKAESYYRQALDIRNRLAPGTLDAAATLNSLGSIAEDRGDLAKAEDNYRQALDINDKLAPGGLKVAVGLNNLGLVANERGDAAKAEDYYRQALDIRKKLEPDSLDVAASLNNLANVADDRGDLTKAEDYYRQALKIGKILAPNGTIVATSLYNLGEDARRRGDLTQAGEHFHRALAMFEKHGPGSLQVAMTLASLGEVARGSGDLAEAADLFQQSLTIDEKLAPGSLDVAAGFNNLAEVAGDRGDLAKSEEYYRQALEIRRKLAPESAGYAESLAALAGIVRAKQANEAVRLYAQALDALESQVAHLGGSSDMDAGVWAKHADYYSAYSDLLLTQKQPELAYQTLERSRARMLLEELTEAHLNIRHGADPSLLEREQTLRRKLAKKSDKKIDLLEGQNTDEQIAPLRKEIDELLREYEDVEGQIRSSNPNYAALTQPQPLSAKEVQQLLDTDTVLLEYSLGEKGSFVFVVTPTSLDSYELPKRSEIEDAAHHVYDLLTSRNRWFDGETSSQRKERLAKSEAEYKEAVAILSQMVIAPIAARLEAKRLLIVADGALQYVPFAVLTVPAGSALKTPVPLIVEHEIVDLPSASVLALLRRQANGRAPALKEVAVLADPVFDKSDSRLGRAARNKQTTEPAPVKETTPSLQEQLTRSLGDVGRGSRTVGTALPRLAFSRQEADAIMAMTTPGEGMEALDFQASRETALNKGLGQFRIVHFATHALLDNEHPELSGLVLSLVDQDGKSQDGFLDLEDVYNLSLPADLVVLSACETGLGKQITGEGLIGLTRGFMYAGASRVVASLWKVDDVATADLMQRFYRGMLKENLRPAAALRQAQMEMQQQKRWSDPYYWAAFTLEGDWR